MTAAPPDPDFEALLAYLGHSRGFDFSGYKRPTLTRRVHKRLEELHLTGFAEYIDYLEVHGDEFEILFNTILINVTSFFRDPSAWAHLAEVVVPAILERAREDDPIRVWTAGCASGEEAYTLAMVFAQAMGTEQFRRRIKIYATDIDEDALSKARAGSYSDKVLADVPADLLERYFEPGSGHRSFRSDLRRAIIFGRHDLTRDAPISRLHLVTCRNTLMYFNAEAQAGIIHRLHYGLRPDGYLFLGRAETLLSHSALFKAVNIGFRIFAKVADDGRLALDEPSGLSTPARERRDDHGGRLRELSFQTVQSPQLIVDAAGTVVAVNDAACAALDLAPNDIGRPFQDLELSYRPVDLRTPIERARLERQLMQLRGVERWAPDQGSRFFDIAITPIAVDQQPALGAAVTFTDVTSLRTLQGELKRTTEELETAYEELQSSNEELETTNEELQSTVEELETTNEELQSTNEELETTNEELRSSNEELEAINEELRIRTGEANEASGYLASIVNGVAVSVVVVDAARAVRTWNVVAQETWGLRADEVLGQSLFDLDCGLPVEQLRGPVEASLSQRGPAEDELIDAVNRRGRPIRCRVTFNPLQSAEHPGVVLLIEEVGAA